LLQFQNLTVYTKALEFVAVVTDILQAMPRGHGHLANQLDRSATSVPANIAEGAGEFSPKEKARFYRIAKRSVTESVAHLDVMRIKNLVQQNRYDRCMPLAAELFAMLTSLARRYEQDS
jgi:four helix bundle protein